MRTVRRAYRWLFEPVEMATTRCAVLAHLVTTLALAVETVVLFILVVTR